MTSSFSDLQWWQGFNSLTVSSPVPCYYGLPISQLTNLPTLLDDLTPVLPVISHCGIMQIIKIGITQI
ncbi:hypothetical protein [Proteus terrae]|uniref:hypothetical protein n=1 Tax=Proteus terrae TaxID=1574161 RepID=UPI0021A78766|nr:hypothetical protein [Proteus terrae]